MQIIANLHRPIYTTSISGVSQSSDMQVRWLYNPCSLMGYRRCCPHLSVLGQQTMMSRFISSSA